MVAIFKFYKNFIWWGTAQSWWGMCPSMPHLGYATAFNPQLLARKLAYRFNVMKCQNISFKMKTSKQTHTFVQEMLALLYSVLLIAEF